MKRTTISCELPSGVNVVVWSGGEEVIHSGDIAGLTLKLEVPMDEAGSVRKKLRGLVGQL
jgi:hypothetical protein